jgi:hypothetical protein
MAKPKSYSVTHAWSLNTAAGTFTPDGKLDFTWSVSVNELQGHSESFGGAEGISENPNLFQKDEGGGDAKNP